MRKLSTSWAPRKTSLPDCLSYSLSLFPKQFSPHRHSVVPACSVLGPLALWHSIQPFKDIRGLDKDLPRTASLQIYQETLQDSWSERQQHTITAAGTLLAWPCKLQTLTPSTSEHLSALHTNSITPKATNCFQGWQFAWTPSKSETTANNKWFKQPPCISAIACRFWMSWDFQELLFGNYPRLKLSKKGFPITRAFQTTLGWFHGLEQPCCCFLGHSHTPQCSGGFTSFEKTLDYLLYGDSDLKSASEEFRRFSSAVWQSALSAVQCFP